MENAEAIQVIQEQVDAYNARDIERFLVCYATDAVILNGDGSTLYQGHEAIRAGYTGLFTQNPAMHVEIPTRIAVGSWVFDEEIVTGLSMEGRPAELHAVAAYLVANGAIQRVQLFS